MQNVWEQDADQVRNDAHPWGTTPASGSASDRLATQWMQARVDFQKAVAKFFEESEQIVSRLLSTDTVVAKIDPILQEVADSSPVLQEIPDSRPILQDPVDSGPKETTSSKKDVPILTKAASNLEEGFAPVVGTPGEVTDDDRDETMVSVPSIKKPSVKKTFLSKEAKGKLFQVSTGLSGLTHRATSGKNSSSRMELLYTRFRLRAEEYITDQLLAMSLFFQNLHEPLRTGTLAGIVHSRCLSIVVFSIILFDASVSCWEANRAAADPASGSSQTMQIADIICTTVYVVEISLKLIVHRFFFFYGPNVSWNVFDFLLTTQALVDLFLQHVAQSTGQSATFLRIIRLMKMGKLLRFFRVVRFLKDLRVMLVSIANCMFSLFWAFVTMGLILYVFALCFLQFMTAYRRESVDGEIEPELQRRMDIYFSSVSRACLALYMAATGGIDWYELYFLVEGAGTLEALCFIAFIGFFNFAVLTILSGVFIEKALRAAEPDRESMALEQRRRELRESEELKILIDAMDEDRSGTLSLEEFVEAVEHEEVQMYLKSLGLNVKDAMMFFNLLAGRQGDSARLEIDDFVRRLHHMKGSATALDMQMLMFDVKLIEHGLKDLKAVVLKESPVTLF